MPKKIKVIEKNLGREKAVGQAYMGENLIEIDPRQNSKEYLGTLLHEMHHICFPDLTEEEVISLEKVYLNVLWKQGYRRIKE